MYEKELDILDNITLEDVSDLYSDEDNTVRMQLSGFIKGEDLMLLCGMVGSVRLTTHGDFEFFFETLTELQVYKMFTLFKEHSKSEEVNYHVRIACELAVGILFNMVKTPCQINLKIDEVGYFQAVEDELGIFISRDKFDEAHEKAHRIISLITSTESTEGYIKKIHRN